LTGQEISSIIELCARANVRKLSYCGLHLEFGEPTDVIRSASPPVVSEPTRATVPALTEEQHTKQTTESLANEEARTKEDRLSIMMIEDPVEYERLVNSGELIDSSEDEDE
jgi:hypothetical protein